MVKVIIKTKLILDGDKRYVELRDYELGKTALKIINCKSRDYKTCYHLREDFMTLSLSEQKRGKVINTQKSMFYPYTYYKLIRFLWKPDGEIENIQVADKEITFDGNVAKLP